MSDQIKQVIVLRDDLGMRKGKMVSQGAHASMSFLLRTNQVPDSQKKYVKDWCEGAFTKIVLRCSSEEELINIYKAAKAANLVTSLIRDNGVTEFGGVATYTAVAVGPGRASDIDKITGDLKLL